MPYPNKPFAARTSATFHWDIGAAPGSPQTICSVGDYQPVRWSISNVCRKTISRNLLTSEISGNHQCQRCFTPALHLPVFSSPHITRPIRNYSFERTYKFTRKIRRIKYFLKLKRHHHCVSYRVSMHRLKPGRRLKLILYHTNTTHDQGAKNEVHAILEYRTIGKTEISLE